MSTNTLKLYSQQSNGVTYADPMDPAMTVRFKTVSTPKMLDGQRTTNYVTEIIVNDIHDIDLGGKVTGDALSVRIRVSGSAEAMSRTKQLVKDVVSQLSENWLDEDVLLGFQPATLPVNTTSGE